MHFKEKYDMEVEDVTIWYIILYVARPEGVYRADMIIPHLTSSCKRTITLNQ